MISGRSPTAKTRILSFNRTQSRVDTCLRTGQNTLRRHLYLTGLTESPLHRRYGAEEQTSPHVLFQCEALYSLRQAYLDSFFLGLIGCKESKSGGHLEL